MSIIKLTAVSYLNTLPFLYGMENSGFMDNSFSIDLQPPYKCASSLLNGQCDIALVPVAALSRLESYYLCTNYCIGADGAVQTVVLASNISLDKVKKIYLDYQSRTSVVLAQVLAKYWWKVSPVWVNATENYLDNLEEDAAYVIIGDRVFYHIHRFSSVLDLAHEWKEFKGMPFVFAAWASLKPVDKAVEHILNQSFEYGIKNIPKLVEGVKSKYEAANIDLLDYYTDKISYQFDAPKREALADFLELSLKL